MEKLERRSMLTAAVAQTALSIHSSDTVVDFGETITLSALITANHGNPSGTITFEDGTDILGSAPINPHDDHAIFTIDTLPVGTHKIEAVYGGTTLYSSSQSSVLKETVDPLQNAPSGGMSISGGTLIYSGPTSTLSLIGSASTFGGVIVNTGTLQFIQSGGGNFVLPGTGSYSGPTIMSSGTLQLGSGDYLLSGNTLSLSSLTNSGTLILSQGVTFSNPISLNETGGEIFVLPAAGETAYLSGPITLNSGVEYRIGTSPFDASLPEPASAGALAVLGAGLLIRRKNRKQRNSEQQSGK
jgi:autotransporter-associated beta strand protein